ncbi:MAG: cellulase family glycosylhydrolase [Candidatus Fimenecus sp.]
MAVTKAIWTQIANTFKYYDNRIIVSVHAYKPYDFSMNPDDNTKFNFKDKKELYLIFKNIDRLFLKRKIPVIIGEENFGLYNRQNGTWFSSDFAKAYTKR